ncbi:MAG TPA: AraC family transcriptional regulator [Woeseiaceae bacterium]|nr:AraC family transcriptional regulator [Woeseiaceae bacterium]
MQQLAQQESGHARSPLSVTARWYLWDGGFLAIGKSEGIVPPHAHHAIQIVIAIEGVLAIRGTHGDWSDCHGAIIRHDAEHSFDGKGARAAMLFVDPESSEGVWLRTALAQEITIVPDKRLNDSISALRTFCERPFESMEIGELIRHCVVSLCPGAPPVRHLDQRVARVLEAIRASDDLRMSLEDAAAIAFLSPSRFAHLFRQQVGLPYRRYLLWRKVTRAMLSIGKERTIGAAAHASDFADAAHLTRTFYQMFGIPPSVMMRGEFFEIASPFSVAG